MAWTHFIAAVTLLAAGTAVGAAQSPPATVAPQAGETLTPEQEAFRRASTAIFIHGRARAFRMMARQRLCRRSHFRGEFESLSRRIDEAGRTLRERYGDFFNRPDENLGRLGCDDARLEITMLGFRNAVVELERFAAQPPPPAR